MTAPIADYIFDGNRTWRSLTPGVPDVVITAASIPDSGAPPAYLGRSTYAATTGSLSRSWIAGHQVNDVALLIVEEANQAPGLTVPAGFVQGPDSPQGTGTAGGTAATGLLWYWCRATSSSMGPVTVSANGGNHVSFVLLFFRGCIETGTPFDVTAGGVAATPSTSVGVPGDTTTVPNCLIVAIGTTATGGTTPQFSAWSNSSLTGLTERVNENTGSGNGGGIGVATGIKATAGAYGTTFATLLTSSVQALVSIALKPSQANVPPAQGPGVPYGPFDLFSSPTKGPGQPGFTSSIVYVSPGTIVAMIRNLRSYGMKGVILKMTGESHDDPSGTDAYRTGGKFDLSKWKAAVLAYVTPAIIQELSQGIADGTLLGYSMIDEPNHATWGGVFTKALLDEMTDFAHGALGSNLVIGTVVKHEWRPGETYEKLQFIVTQTWEDDIVAGATVFRDAAIAQQTAERGRSADGKAFAIIFSINLRVGRPNSSCAVPTDGGTHCMITGTDLQTFGTTLGTAPKCAMLLLWRWKATDSPNPWDQPSLVTAMATIGTALATAVPAVLDRT